jgi:myosin heavy subunit
MNEENHLKSNQGSFYTLKSDSSLSSFKPADLDDGFFYVNDNQEFSLVNRNSGLHKPRKYPVAYKSNERIPNYRPRLSTEKLSPSNHFCLSCVRHLQTIEELKKDQEKSSERYFLTEKHLKQYDNLLQIKDKRLAQDEATLKADFEFLENEKEKLKKEQKRLEAMQAELLIEKEQNELKKFELTNYHRENVEKDQILEQFSMVLKEKELEITRISKENDELKRKVQELVLVNGEQSNKMKLLEPKILAEKFPDIEKFRAKFNEKKNKLKLVEREMEILNNELKQKQQFIHEKNLFIESEERRLENDRKMLDEAKKQVFEEFESVEELKIILKVEEDNLNRERELLKEKYDAKVADVEELKQKLADNIKRLMEEKELFTTETRDVSQDKLEKIIIDLEAKVKHLSQSEKVLTEKNEKLTNFNINLQKDLEILKEKYDLLVFRTEEIENNEDLLESSFKNEEFQKDSSESSEKIKNIDLFFNKDSLFEDINKRVEDANQELKNANERLLMELDSLREAPSKDEALDSYRARAHGRQTNKEEIHFSFKS